MRSGRLITLLLLSCLCGLASGQGSDSALDEKVLRQAKVPTDDAGLLAFFRTRTASQAELKKLSTLLESLGSTSYSAREQAIAALQKAGALARPVLKEALAHADREIARRASLCLRRLDQGNQEAEAVAAARLIARRKLPQAPQVLLDYLPFAPSPMAAAEVCRALAANSVGAGRVDPAVVEALKDRFAEKRGAAGVALVRAASAAHLPAVRALLHDADPQVRLHVALALLDVKDKAAVPVLIDLMAVLPDTDFWDVEEVLQPLAGPHAPSVTRDSVTSAVDVRAAWMAWWKARGTELEFPGKTAKDLHGYTLITNPQQGEILECASDGKVLWRINGLSGPKDAQVVGDNRVLVAEYYGRRVTERDLEGKILWRYDISSPIVAQRLPGGRTFIASRRQLVVVERGGKEVFTYNHPNLSIAAARRLRNGQTVVLDSSGVCTVLDASGHLLKTFDAGTVGRGHCIDVLPDGRILLPLAERNKVVEYDRAGKVLWEASVASPTSAVRLPDGHTLVSSATEQRVVELDGSGQEVWQLKSAQAPGCARRR